MIKTYRTTVIVQAEQFDGSNEMIDRYELTYSYYISAMRDEEVWQELGGVTMEVAKGDWVVTNDKDEHWAIADDVFKQTYVEAEE